MRAEGYAGLEFERRNLKAEGVYGGEVCGAEVEGRSLRVEEVLSRSVPKVWEVMRGRSEGGCLQSERVWSAGV